MLNFKELPVNIVLEVGVDIPHYATDGSSGFDLRAVIDSPITLYPGQRATISTGIRVECPWGTEVQIRPRSGLAHKNGLTVLNSPGTIDLDYTGILGVILINNGSEPHKVMPGDRIAQGVLCPVYRAKFNVVKGIGETARGEGGYGSTGIQ